MRKVRLGRFQALLAILFLVGGCRQGLGERCQIDSDCESGLVCSQSRVCDMVRGMMTSDAPIPPPVDAPIPPPVDAPANTVDAPPVDAAPTPNA